jgi:hypothetical protein
MTAFGGSSVLRADAALFTDKERSRMRDDRKRLRTGAFVGLLATVFVLVAASVSGAALLKAGGLGSAATISLPEPVDTAFWLTARKGGGSAQIHTRGLVELVSVRGCARPAPTGQLPLTQIHIQTLTPGAGGSVSVKLTTGPLNMPICGQGASPSTVTAFKFAHLCVVKGDYVDFNVEGGFGPGFPQGVRYEVFGRAAGAVTDSFTSANGTNNGATLTGTAHAGVRLLMAMVIATGRDARGCR